MEGDQTMKNTDMNNELCSLRHKAALLFIRSSGLAFLFAGTLMMKNKNQPCKVFF